MTDTQIDRAELAMLRVRTALAQLEAAVTELDALGLHDAADGLAQTRAILAADAVITRRAMAERRG